MARESDSGKSKDANSPAPEGERKSKLPGSDNSPGQGGFHHADTRMGHAHSEALGEAERIVTGKDKPSNGSDDEIDKTRA